MRRSRWRTGSALLALLAIAALPTGRAEGQLLSARTLLDSPFDPSARSSMPRPRLLTLWAQPAQPRGSVTTGFYSAETARTRQAGQHVGDLIGSGRYVDTDWNTAGLDAAMTWRSTSQDALLVSAGGNRTTAALRAEEQDVLVGRRLGGNGLYLRAVTSTDSLTLHSDLLSGTPIFAGSAPEGGWNRSQHEIGVGLTRSIGRYIEVEGALAHALATGTLSLSNATHRLSAPAGAAGWSATIAARIRPDQSTDIIAFGQTQALRGHGAVHWDATALGIGQVAQQADGWGIGVRRTFGATGALRLTLAQTQEALEYHAFDLAPTSLGSAGAGLDRVGYYVEQRVTRREIGVRWEQRFRRGNRLQFNYSWLETPLRAAAGVTASSFLFGIEQGGAIDLPDARGHLLRLQYSFPVPAATATLDLSQLIPLAVGRSTSGGGGPSGPPRRTTGGWTVQFTLHRSF